MERIVQLTVSEYEKLNKDAEMKHSEIVRRADEMYKKKGAYSINLELDCQENYRSELELCAYAYVKEWDGVFPISYKDKKRVVDFVKSRALEMMQKKFGKQISDRNAYKKRIDEIDKERRRFINVTLLGWLVALALVIITFIK